MIWFGIIGLTIFVLLLVEILLLYKLLQKSSALMASSLGTIANTIVTSLKESSNENIKEFSKISTSFDSNLSNIEKIALGFAEGLTGMKENFEHIRALVKVYTSSPPMTFRLPLSGQFERFTPPIVIHLPLADPKQINPERKISYD